MHGSFNLKLFLCMCCVHPRTQTHMHTNAQAVILNICKTEIGNVYLNGIYLSVAVGVSPRFGVHHNFYMV